MSLFGRLFGGSTSSGSGQGRRARFNRRHLRARQRETVSLLDASNDRATLEPEIFDASYIEVAHNDLQLIANITDETRTWRLPVINCGTRPEGQMRIQDASGEIWTILRSRYGRGRVTWHCVCVLSKRRA